MRYICNVYRQSNVVVAVAVVVVVVVVVDDDVFKHLKPKFNICIIVKGSNT